MTDNLTKEKRSWIMSRIKNKNTKPEIQVRSLLHSMGFRFRLHRRDLPGKPDIVLPKYNTAIFVNGCFWHVHENCKDSTIPKTNTSFWEKKLKRNIERDRKIYDQLKGTGWKVVIVWECELKNIENIKLRLSREIHEKKK
jgi:DNA mismatch endonuclease (patch repair protein)